MTVPSDPNRAWWNERAALHGQDRVYDTEAFLGGRSTLFALDHETAGDVTGRDLVHLQCHTGMDTLSWLRAGARSVTGIDFSDVAIAKATDTAAAAGAGAAATFVTADVLDVPGTLHGRFDVCFASIGVFSWIGDVTAWMRTAHGVLRPGGVLAVVDLHPLFVMASSFDPLVLDFPYVNDGPRALDDQSGSYADPARRYRAERDGRVRPLAGRDRHRGRRRRTGGRTPRRARRGRDRRWA